MSKRIPAAEAAGTSQVLSITLLIGLAWLPLIPHIELRVDFYIGFLLVLRLASLRWPRLAPGRWLLLPLTLAGIATVLATYRTLAGQGAGTALLATMLTLKLLEVRRLRDIRVATVLFGFLLVSQFLFDQSPLRALYLALLLLLDFALMADLTARAQEGRQAFMSALRTAARLFVQAIPLTIVLFLLFPRLSAPLWSLPQQSEKGRTGMSDWMEPGSVSQLVLSGETAFRARFEGPLPAPDQLYWRGIVAWHSDGRRWTGWPADVPVGTAKELLTSGEEIAYRVDLEPSGKRWLFALDMPVEIQGDARTRGDFQVLASKPIEGTRSYRAVSALRYNTGELDLDLEMAGTQLPDNITPRMRALVAEWQQGSENSQDLVRKGLDHFRTEPFFYSLQPPKLDENPADQFLFETRRGFCEHYASSFALLMRIAGIPSRVVLGYLGGEYNPMGKYLIVRQSDAHAWVEVWLAGQGWVRVDPTAAVAPERIERNDLLTGLGAGAPARFRLEDVDTLLRWAHNLRLLGDAIETGWRDWVVGLSSSRQQRMLEVLGLGPLRQYGLVIALVVTATVVLVILLTALTRSGAPLDPVERIYATFCKRLSRIGLSRGKSEGPQAYSRRVSAARPDLARAIETFMALYLPQRYGARGRPEHRRALALALRRFRPARRPEPRRPSKH